MSYKRTTYDLEKAIKSGRAAYRQKLEDSLASSNSKDLWNRIQRATNYKPAASTLRSDDESLPNELNQFYARFVKGPPTSLPGPIDGNDDEPPFSVCENDV